jgi:hypothetical protein
MARGSCLRCYAPVVSDLESNFRRVGGEDGEFLAILAREAVAISNVLQAIRRMRNDEGHEHQSPIFAFDDVPVRLEKRVQIIVVIVE